MLSLKQILSNRVIRKGDYFGVYVDITNGYDSSVEISEIKLVAPMGIAQTEKDKRGGQISAEAKIVEGKIVAGKEIVDLGLIRSINPHRMIEHESVFNPDQGKTITINPTSTYRHAFNLRAGRWYGSHPKPDIHIVSVTIVYKQNNIRMQEQMNIPISIFPSFSSMIIGTLVGGLLGTLAGERFMSADPSFSLSPTIVPILFVNLIFSFIGGVVLMRRKDVQSFITIEDFWGGILLGFVVGYAGFEGLIRLFGVPIDQSASTDTAGFIIGA